MNDDFYVYVHFRESDKKPFYIGKGKGRRAFDLKGKARNSYWHKVANKHGVSVDFVAKHLTENEAFELEKLLIKSIRDTGVKLTNITDGGDGNSGLVFTDQQRLNIQKGLKSKRYANSEAKEITIKRHSAYGDKNHFADTNIYIFVRLEDGYEVSCSRHELCEKFKVDKALLKKLFHTNPRKSADGWRLKKGEGNG